MTSNWVRILTKEFEIHSGRFLKAVPIITAPFSAIKHSFFLSSSFTANNCTAEVQIYIVSSRRVLRSLMAALCVVVECYSTITYFSEAGRVIFSQCV